jgi:hypothetical protein
MSCKLLPILWQQQQQQPATDRRSCVRRIVRAECGHPGNGAESSAGEWIAASAVDLLVLLASVSSLYGYNGLSATHTAVPDQYVVNQLQEE